MIRAEVQQAARRPDPEGWAEILRLLCDPALPAAQRVVEVAWLRQSLAAWPPEVSRPPPGPVKLAEARRTLMRGLGPHDPLHWATGLVRDLAPICRVVKETDLYGLYVERICGSELLRLRDGTQAVHLERQFVGALAGRRVGKVGAADLCGWLTVERCDDPAEWTMRQPPAVWRRVAVHCEVEVKTDAGKMTPEQAARGEALRRQGAIYMVVRRTEEAIALLCAERDRIASELA